MESDDRHSEGPGRALVHSYSEEISDSSKPEDFIVLAVDSAAWSEVV
jgi:hypothetical protein